MSKEYHVFTNHQINHEQAFVFEVERDNEHELIQLKELWIVTSQRNGEVKTRVMLENMIHSIVETEGGNISDESVSTVLDVFNEVLGPEKTQEVQHNVEEKILLKKCANDLIFASELASLAHDNIGNIQAIVDEVISKQSTVGRNEKN